MIKPVSNHLFCDFKISNVDLFLCLFTLQKDNNGIIKICYLIHTVNSKNMIKIDYDVTVIIICYFFRAGVMIVFFRLE
jgi:hypothetical protein